MNDVLCMRAVDLIEKTKIDSRPSTLETARRKNRIVGWIAHPENTLIAKKSNKRGWSLDELRIMELK